MGDKERIMINDARKPYFQLGENNAPLINEQPLQPASRFAQQAKPILLWLAQFPHWELTRNIDNLRDYLSQQLKQFTKNAALLNIPDQEVNHASYILCVTIDEIILHNCPNVANEWGQQSLLSIFHQETWGGEKFFFLLEKINRQPQRHLDLLELIYDCLGVGFQGKYRLAPDGNNQLQKIRQDIQKILLRFNKYTQDLTLHHYHVSKAVKTKYIPRWLIALIAGALLVSIFTAYKVSLNQQYQPLTQQGELK